MTAATTGHPANVSAYLAQLRAELADLAPDERDDLLAEVEASLLDSAGDQPLDAQFGPPAAFAADLRASAGLPPAPVAKALRAPRVDWAPVLEKLRVLAPVWWVLRGYVAVAACALAFDQMWFASQRAVPMLGGGPELSALVIAAAIAVSVALGLSGRVPRVVAIAADLVLVLALVPVVAHVTTRPSIWESSRIRVVTAPPPDGLAYYGTAVNNIYPYDRYGRLLHDVRLYGADGHPLDIGQLGADPLRRSVETRRGVALNAFPIRYRDPGTGKVTHPDAGPHVVAPPIKTPPLK